MAKTIDVYVKGYVPSKSIMLKDGSIEDFGDAERYFVKYSPGELGLIASVSQKIGTIAYQKEEPTVHFAKSEADIIKKNHLGLIGLLYETKKDNEKFVGLRLSQNHRAKASVYGSPLDMTKPKIYNKIKVHGKSFTVTPGCLLEFFADKKDKTWKKEYDTVFEGVGMALSLMPTAKSLVTFEFEGKTYHALENLLFA